jgi:hypothetical protein
MLETPVDQQQEVQQPDTDQQASAVLSGVCAHSIVPGLCRLLQSSSSRDRQRVPVPCQSEDTRSCSGPS